METTTLMFQNKKNCCLMNSRRRTDLARLVFPSCQLDEVLVERQVVTDGVLISKAQRKQLA